MVLEAKANRPCHVRVVYLQANGTKTLLENDFEIRPVRKISTSVLQTLSIARLRLAWSICWPMPPKKRFARCLRNLTKHCINGMKTAVLF